MYAPSRSVRRSRRSGLPAVLFSALMIAAALLLFWIAASRLSALFSDDPSGGLPPVGAKEPAPTISPEPTESAAPSEPPAEAAPAPELPWNLTLVNWENPLPEDFAAPELIQLRNGHAIDARAYPDLQAMMDAARAEGLRPLICSSFRTWEGQDKLYRAQVKRELSRGYGQSEAEAQAALWVARPGTSEHELGLAVDIVDMGYQILDERQEDTPVQRWLMEHCWEYGFILRYPTDKSEITHIGYEPWHYRYVGREAAKEIMERGLCLEEYLALG